MQTANQSGPLTVLDPVRPVLVLLSIFARDSQRGRSERFDRCLNELVDHIVYRSVCGPELPLARA